MREGESKREEIGVNIVSSKDAKFRNTSFHLRGS